MGGLGWGCAANTNQPFILSGHNSKAELPLSFIHSQNMMDLQSLQVSLAYLAWNLWSDHLHVVIGLSPCAENLFFFSKEPDLGRGKIHFSFCSYYYIIHHWGSYLLLWAMEVQNKMGTNFYFILHWRCDFHAPLIILVMSAIEFGLLNKKQKRAMQMGWRGPLVFNYPNITPHPNSV